MQNTENSKLMKRKESENFKMRRLEADNYEARGRIAENKKQGNDTVRSMASLVTENIRKPKTKMEGMANRAKNFLAKKAAGKKAKMKK
jgi:hypothetical protein